MCVCACGVYKCMCVVYFSEDVYKIYETRDKTGQERTGPFVGETKKIGGGISNTIAESFLLTPFPATDPCEDPCEPANIIVSPPAPSLISYTNVFLGSRFLRVISLQYVARADGSLATILM